MGWTSFYCAFLSWMTVFASVATMQNLESLHTLTASQVLELYRNDTITVEDYAQALLARVKARDGIVGAWTYLGRFELCGI